MSLKENTVFKIVILGRYSVGKTSVLKRFALDKFSKSYRSTIGCDIVTRTIEYDGIPITLQLWDTSGQEKFSEICHLYYRGADACILMYDTTDDKSFHDLDYWKEQFIKNTTASFPDLFPFLLIGNKVDIHKRKISIRRAEKWCEKNNDMNYIETSAKKAFNIEHAFRVITQQAIKYNEMEAKMYPELTKSSSRLRLDDKYRHKEKSCCYN